MKGSNIRITIIGVLLSIHVAFGCPKALHMESWYISLVHHFFHANIFHLAVNCLSVWTLFRGGFSYNLAPLVWAFIIGSASWFCTSTDAVGFSNILFALIGLRTPSLRSRYWRDPAVIAFVAITILMALLPQVSAITHIVSFVLGCIVAGASRIVNNISRDFRRATYC